MSGWGARCWAAVWQSGWFSPGGIGSVFPFPETWQGWTILVAFLAALTTTVPFHGDAVVLGRILLCLVYIGIGFATFE